MRCQKNDNGFTVEDQDFKLNLAFQHDDLELRGDLRLINDECEAVDADSLIKMLQRLGLQGTIDVKSVQALCDAADADRKQAAFAVVMYGRPPVHGVHGKLEMLRLPGKGADGRSETVVNVLVGQAVAVCVPPTSGEVGMTLNGKLIPAHAGAAVKIRLGHGVVWAVGADPEHCIGEIVATVDGRVVHDALAGTLSVLDTLLIEESINHKYGDIDFIGAIEIRGDVESGHMVKAGKSLKISGNAESVHLEAGGDMEIGGGVAGKEKGVIKASGNVSMRYLDSCHIECGGNLTVRNEIVDSVVMAGGYVDVSNGSIIGGRIVSLGGIEAKVFGSEAGIHTVLNPGRNFVAEREIAALTEEEHKITARLEEISRKLDHYIKNPQQLVRLSDHERQDLQRLTGEFTRANMHLMDIPGQIAAIQNSMQQHVNPMVNVGKMISRGVEIIIANVSVVIPETMHQSNTIVKNSIADGFRYIPRVRLVDNALRIEHEIASLELQRAQQQKL